MSILCSYDVYGRLEYLLHQAKNKQISKQEAIQGLVNIIEGAEDGDMLSSVIIEIFKMD